MASNPPDAFLSYTRFDDRHDGGAISEFCRRLASAARAVTGVPFDIFQDVEGIGLGEHWPGKLDQMLDQARFFIPIVTPSYFTSRPCRAELEKFLGAEAERGRNDLVLPIYYIECDVLEDEELRTTDPLASRLHERQRQDWRELRFEPFEAANIRKALEQLARKIADARRRVALISLEEFKARLPITKIVGRYLRLSRRGQDMWGRCPFHNDEKASFYVAADKGFYHCFSCGKHGNAIDFLMDAEDLDLDQAVTRIVELTGLPAPRLSGSRIRPVVARESTGIEPGTVFRDIDAPWCPEMVVIPPGEFIMGSTEAECRWEVARGATREWMDWEKPQHQVRIDYPLAVGRYPVTFEEYDHFAGATGCVQPEDEGWGRGRRPAINVTWEDAKAFSAWLAATTGQRYRLLSEAEWEYSCRAGTTTRYWWGDEITPQNANYDSGKTRDVGSYPANPFGLYDMHGNVSEWVEDRWHDSYDGAPDDGSAWIAGTDPRRVMRGAALPVDQAISAPPTARGTGSTLGTSAGSGSPGRSRPDSFNVLLLGSGAEHRTTSLRVAGLGEQRAIRR